MSISAIRRESVATSNPRQSSYGKPEPSAAMTGVRSPRSTALAPLSPSGRMMSSPFAAAGSVARSRAGFLAGLLLLLLAARRILERVERAPVLGAGRAGEQPETQ